MNRVLLISPDKNWIESAEGFLKKENFTVESATKGKEGQLKAYQSTFDYIFLDLSVTLHTGMEVFKYLKTSGNQASIFVTAPSLEWLETNGLAKNNLLKMGTVGVYPALQASQVVEAIKALGKIKGWENLEGKVRSENEGEEETTIADDLFTRLKIEELFQDVVAVNDFYIRLGANKYVKIFNKGELTSSAQLQKYSKGGQKFIYFPTKDRAIFISYQNELAKRAIATSDNPGGVVIKAMKSASDKLTEELKDSGIQPALLEEGKAICQNIYDSAKKDRGLRDIVTEFEKFDPKTFSDSFLVSFFSTVICKNVEWVGTKTIENLALGGLLHDIGTMQLEDSLRTLEYDKMTDEQKEKFHQHPLMGAEALKKIPRLNSGVLMIVQQHHEYNDGSGFPVGLPANKIFPLAKIVSLADGLTDYIRENEVGIKEGLRGFLSIRENLMKYEPELIRNLINGFRA
jgi:HD-GYP domain-containing protein (c-di-GMP phosphodiesterase class II)